MSWSTGYQWLDKEKALSPEWLKKNTLKRATHFTVDRSSPFSRPLVKRNLTSDYRTLNFRAGTRGESPPHFPNSATTVIFTNFAAQINKLIVLLIESLLLRFGQLVC